MSPQMCRVEHVRMVAVSNREVGHVHVHDVQRHLSKSFHSPSQSEAGTVLHWKLWVA